MTNVKSFSVGASVTTLGLNITSEAEGQGSYSCEVKHIITLHCLLLK